MTRAPQLRVRLQLARLASLERIYLHSHLTVGEAREMRRLREAIAKRRAVRAWLSRGDNAARNAANARQWREANPECR